MPIELRCWTRGAGPVSGSWRFRPLASRCRRDGGTAPPIDPFALPRWQSSQQVCGHCSEDCLVRTDPSGGHTSITLRPVKLERVNARPFKNCPTLGVDMQNGIRR